MKKWYHLAFILVCATVVVVLLNAPEVTTPRLPDDANHADRKDYPRCPSCHGANAEEVPMPEDHFGSDGALRPDHLKCYFCHKPQEE